MFAGKAWGPTDRLLTHRGYAIRKDALNAAETSALRKALTVKPFVPEQFSAGVQPFPIFYESKTRWYTPRFWGIEHCGPLAAEHDLRRPGTPLRPELRFSKTLRTEQTPIVGAFEAGGCNGLICVPCGIGKTFMGIYTAVEIVKKRFLILVHQEFLADQWETELKEAVPGIRVGRVQGSTVQLGAVERPPPTVQSLKAELKARGLAVGGRKDELVARLAAAKATETETETETETYDCVICMIQTVASRDWASDAFADFGFTIGDECHHLGAEYFSKALAAIQTLHMMGLSATPNRADGLDRVFLQFIGPVRFQMKVREADESVEVRVIRFTSADPAYADTPLDCRGEVSQPLLCNQLASYTPRTLKICDSIEAAAHEGRHQLVLSDRREHLVDFENEMRRRGFTSIGYYVGGMKSAAREESAKCRIILGTFTLASEGMNIKTLDTVTFATPKSGIEQAAGRILRLKKAERKFSPRILEVLDLPHLVCVRKFKKRCKYYKLSKYTITYLTDGKEEDEVKATKEDEDEDEDDEDDEVPPKPTARPPMFRS